MKTSAIICAIVLCISTLNAEEAPSLSLAEAAQIAQSTLTDLHLPADNFLRSISLQHKPSETPSDYYIATFEPPKLRRVTKDSDTPTEPTKIKFIKIAFDGKSTVVEENMPERRIIREKKN